MSKFLWFIDESKNTYVIEHTIMAASKKFAFDRAARCQLTRLLEADPNTLPGTSVIKPCATFSKLQVAGSRWRLTQRATS